MHTVVVCCVFFLSVWTILFDMSSQLMLENSRHKSWNMRATIFTIIRPSENYIQFLTTHEGSFLLLVYPLYEFGIFFRVEENKSLTAIKANLIGMNFRSVWVNMVYIHNFETLSIHIPPSPHFTRIAQRQRQHVSVMYSSGAVTCEITSVSGFIFFVVAQKLEWWV